MVVSQAERFLNWLDNVDPGEVSAALARHARGLAIVLCAGSIAGMVAGGIGGRLAMRLSGIFAGPELQGAITQNANVVGHITVGGTIELIVFSGLLDGLFAGFVYMALQPWLRNLGGLAPLGFGLILLAAFGSVRIDPQNADFRRFGPPILNVSMFAAIFVLCGVLLTKLAPALDQVMLQPREGGPAVGRVAQWSIAIVILVAGLSLLAVIVGGTVDFFVRATPVGIGIEHNLVFLGILLAGAVGRYLRARVALAGPGLASIAVVAGLADTVASIAGTLGISM